MQSLITYFEINHSGQEARAACLRSLRSSAIPL